MNVPREKKSHFHTPSADAKIRIKKLRQSSRFRKGRVKCPIIAFVPMSVSFYFHLGDLSWWRHELISQKKGFKLPFIEQFLALERQSSGQNFMNYFKRLFIIFNDEIRVCQWTNQHESIGSVPHHYYSRTQLSRQCFTVHICYSVSRAFIDFPLFRLRLFPFWFFVHRWMLRSNAGVSRFSDLVLPCIQGLDPQFSRSNVTA